MISKYILIAYLPYNIRYSSYLKGENPQSWLGHAQSVETLCDELSDTDLLE